ncbi:hypothetical protein, partial [Lacticaseibacillus zeae]|uniref:hypothetical protein n=1 Tax=Lacticaseibacillus zeae TaxID=57037 RepID=UPI0012E37A86
MSLKFLNDQTYFRPDDQTIDLEVVLRSSENANIKNRGHANRGFFACNLGSRIFGVGKYFHSKSTRPFLITKKASKP